MWTYDLPTTEGYYWLYTGGDEPNLIRIGPNMSLAFHGSKELCYPDQYIHWNAKWQRLQEQEPNENSN